MERFRAVIVTPVQKPEDKPVQTICKTLDGAKAWAALVLPSQPTGSVVKIYRAREVLYKVIPWEDAQTKLK